MQYYVYILASNNRKTIYTGVTNDLKRRLWEHRNAAERSFVQRYHVCNLIYYETTTDVRAAIEREKQIKSWSRKKKEQLIETKNPKWEDLSFYILEN